MALQLFTRCAKTQMLRILDLPDQNILFDISDVVITPKDHFHYS